MLTQLRKLFVCYLVTMPLSGEASAPVAASRSCRPLWARASSLRRRLVGGFPTSVSLLCSCLCLCSVLLHTPALLVIASHCQATSVPSNRAKRTASMPCTFCTEFLTGAPGTKVGQQSFPPVIFLYEHHHRRPPSTIPRSSQRAREHCKPTPQLHDHSFTVDDPVSEPPLVFFFHLSSLSSRAIHGEPLILPYPRLNPIFRVCSATTRTPACGHRPAGFAGMPPCVDGGRRIPHFGSRPKVPSGLGHFLPGWAESLYWQPSGTVPIFFFLSNSIQMKFKLLKFIGN
jgi:hypothetical protein